MTPQLDALGMAVADMAATWRSTGASGSTSRRRRTTEGHVEATLPGGLRLMWDSQEMIKSFDPAWQQPAGAGRISLAFLCGSSADVDSKYAELVEAGYRGTKEPWDAFWGQRYAEVLDPDGNAVHLFARL